MRLDQVFIRQSTKVNPAVGELRHRFSPENFLSAFNVGILLPLNVFPDNILLSLCKVGKKVFSFFHELIFIIRFLEKTFLP